MPAVEVKLATASAIKVPRVLTLSGTLTGNEQAKVAAGAVGKVVATFIERGQVVKKGAVLVQLDSRAVRAQAEEAAAQLESLKAQRAQAELDCARSQRMFNLKARPASETGADEVMPALTPQVAADDEGQPIPDIPKRVEAAS